MAERSLLRIIASLAAALALPLALPAAAQDVWPTRAVRLVVPSSPGGGTDLYARLLAQALGESLKQPFIVDNKPGASGNIGAETVAKAAPDGYTFLVSANPALTINPSLYRNLPYSAERDFVAVARGVLSPMVVCVHPGVPARSLADLIALAKRERGTLAFGSAGTGSTTYLGVRMIEEASGVRFLHVPYKGVGPAYKDLLGGQLTFMLADLASALPHIKSGKAVALAVTERTAALPATPTLAEAGLPNLEVYSSFGVVAPTGTPPAIVQRLGAEIVKAMKSPQLAEKLDAQALIPIFDTPELAAASMKKEREVWAAFIQRNGIVSSE
jgi:tripartite-type tricarboxylate transporter receptor subunit TctC